LTYKKWFRIGMVEQNDPRVEAAITAIKEALAQPAQEPSQASYPEYDRGFSEGWDRCKAAAQRPWVGLTDEEISATSKGHIVRSTYARAIESKLKEKNFD
jgi:hypothetical protein